MAYGNKQQMWSLKKYIEEYDKLKAENKRLKEALEKAKDKALEDKDV